MCVCVTWYLTLREEYKLRYSHVVVQHSKNIWTQGRSISGIEKNSKCGTARMGHIADMTG
jgi:hypothetical protein